MPEIRWRCKVENNSPRIFNRVDWQQHVARLEGKICELILREPKTDANFKEDELRKYYFGCVADVIAKETGNSTHDVHETMKLMFSSEVDEYGILKSKNVFSRGCTSDLEKKRFITNVRSWAFDFLGIRTDPYGSVD